jgi:hypothetical protein
VTISGGFENPDGAVLCLGYRASAPPRSAKLVLDGQDSHLANRSHLASFEQGVVQLKQLFLERPGYEALDRNPRQRAAPQPF